MHQCIILYNGVYEKMEGKVSRRETLKSIGGAAIALSGATGAANACVGTASGPSNFVGYAYDPNSLEILGEATGDFQTLGKKIDGQIDLGDRQVSISRNTPAAVRGKPESQLYHFPKWERVDENKPYRKVKAVSTGHAVTGYVRDPSMNKVAFALMPEWAPRSDRLDEFIRKAAPNGKREYTRGGSR